MAESVKVIVRCRPINDREKNLSCSVVVDMDPTIGQCILSKPKSTGKEGQKAFTFDGVYFVDSTTDSIYSETAFPLVDSVLEGFNGTVFAYGQTGCGKSYTMMGVPDPPTQLGVIPRTFDHIFNRAATTTSVKYLIHASYLEIYNEEVRDLLGKDVKRKLELKEHPSKGVYVQGLSKHRVVNIPSLEKVLDLGSKNRSVGETLMNVDSSRSHSIFTIEIESSQLLENGKENIRVGKLNLVDLAGSERQSKTGATGDRLKEATKINLSLSALGNVISALVDGKSKHIPYRDSKLTRLLQSSLGGNTKTLMVACISPADNNYDETLSTLRYANRAKNIKNKPKINEDPKDALLREYREEIQRLKALIEGDPSLALATTNMDERSVSVKSVIGDEFEAEKEAIRQQYEREIARLKENFSSEQQTTASLQQQLQQLQLQYRQSLDSLNAKAQPTGGPNQPLMGSLGGPSASGDAGMVLSQIQDLESVLVGGEAASNLKLKEELDEKRRLAEERQLKIQEASDSIFLDDEILVKIYNSLTEEVSAKHSLAVQERDKRKSAEEDIKDLQAEFQAEREDYLATIRRQQQTMQLQEQLLATIVPCLRRDCNYYNIDKVRSESKWDDEQGEWILPKLTITRTDLRSVRISTSASSLQITSSPHNSPSRSQHGSHTRRSVDNTDSLFEVDFEDDNQLLNHLSQPETSDYFKPKRAEVLLSSSNQLAGSKSNGNSDALCQHKSPGRLQPLKKSQDPLAIVEQAERKIGHKKLQPIFKLPP